MKPSTAAILAALLLAACYNNEADGERLKAQWQKQLAALPVGADSAQIKAWAWENRIFLTADRQGYTAAREFLGGGDAACQRWLVTLTVKTDVEGRVLDSQVESTCD